MEYRTLFNKYIWVSGTDRMLIDTQQSIMKKSYPTATVFILNFIWTLDVLFEDPKTRSLRLTARGAEKVAWL